MTVIRQRTEQAVSPAELALELERGHDCQTTGVESQEGYLATLLGPEFIRLRQMNTPETRRVMKIIACCALREVMKWRIEDLCVVFSADDHAPIGLATVERWKDAAERYLKQRLPSLERSGEMLEVPAQRRHESSYSTALRHTIDTLTTWERDQWREQWEADYAAIFGRAPQRSSAIRQRKPKQNRKPSGMVPEERVNRQQTLFD